MRERGPQQAGQHSARPGQLSQRTEKRERARQVGVNFTVKHRIAPNQPYGSPTRSMYVRGQLALSTPKTNLPATRAWGEIVPAPLRRTYRSRLYRTIASGGITPPRRRSLDTTNRTRGQSLPLPTGCTVFGRATRTRLRGDRDDDGCSRPTRAETPSRSQNKRVLRAARAVGNDRARWLRTRNGGVQKGRIGELKKDGRGADEAIQKVGARGLKRFPYGLSDPGST